MTFISEFYRKSLMKLTKICEMIISKEIRRIKSDSSILGLALNMDSRGKNRNCKDG